MQIMKLRSCLGLVDRGQSRTSPGPVVRDRVAQRVERRRTHSLAELRDGDVAAPPGIEAVSQLDGYLAP